MTNHTIFPSNLQIAAAPPVASQCSFCGSTIKPEDISAGPCDLHGDITYVCNNHLRDPRQFINLLADFMSTQRFALAQDLDYQKLNTRKGNPDAWFLH